MPNPPIWTVYDQRMCLTSDNRIGEIRAKRPERPHEQRRAGQQGNDTSPPQPDGKYECRPLHPSWIDHPGEHAQPIDSAQRAERREDEEPFLAAIELLP